MNNDVTADAWQRPSPEPTGFSRPFWEATRERRLLLQYCTVAQKFQHYPRPVSIYTGRKTIEWRAVAGAGQVYAFTVTHRAPPAFRGREPTRTSPGPHSTTLLISRTFSSSSMVATM